jgi:membrane associated rhomboid family serine protease
MGPLAFIRKPFRYSFGNATLFLVGINIAIFGLQILFPGRVEFYLALSPPAVASGWVWQIFTYMFLHANGVHLLFNMIALFLFGTRIERRTGTKEFLLFYLVCGTLAGLFSFVFYMIMGTSNVFLLGASGAIYALLLAFAAFFPDERIFIWGLLPVKAPLLVLGYAAIEIVSQIFPLNVGVAHLTHLSGLGVAWLYFLLRYGINPWKRFFLR